MDDILEYVIGAILGVVATNLYNKMCDEKNKWKVKKIKRELSEIDIFSGYEQLKESIPIVSFGDSKAIKIGPLQQSGIYILKADIDLKNKPKTGENRDFVMALLKYIPSLNWKYYCEMKYSFKFKIRGNIKGIRLEIKDNRIQKIMDEYIPVTQDFREHAFLLKGDSAVWENIEEICFTVFCENEYIDGDTGKFEIINCRLDK